MKFLKSVNDLCQNLMSIFTSKTRLINQLQTTCSFKSTINEIIGFHCYDRLSMIDFHSLSILSSISAKIIFLTNLALRRQLLNQKESFIEKNLNAINNRIKTFFISAVVRWSKQMIFGKTPAGFTCSKLTIKQGVKYVDRFRVIKITDLLLTLNIFHILF